MISVPVRFDFVDSGFVVVSVPSSVLGDGYGFILETEN